MAVYIVLGVNLTGRREVLGHWVGDGAEGANFWLSVITDLQTRGVHSSEAVDRRLVELLQIELEVSWDGKPVDSDHRHHGRDGVLHRQR